jgi:anaerobic magnesium-protoporphyrin IX monomethyl ester cyclase
MRIALINVQLLDGNNVVAPLGVLYIAGRLEDDGHTVAVFDGDPDAFPLGDEVVAWKPELVGLGFLTAASTRANALLQSLKRRLPPSVFFMAGGVHPTIFPEPTLRLGADVVVTGEGEDTAGEVVARVARGERDMRGVAGTVCLAPDGSVVDNGARALMPELSALPRPARHLIDFTPYLAPPGVIRGYSMSKVATVFSTRGCPYGCIYCGSHNIFGRKIRYRPVEDVVDEIADLRRAYGVRGIYFCDDLFTLDKQWVLDFCKELSTRMPGQIRWACQTRVDAVHVEILQTMYEAGCVQVDFGVESGSQRILKILSRKMPKEKILTAFRTAQSVGLRTCATFIIGSPEEELDDLEQSFQLAKELRADYTAFYYATPYPGTKLYDLAVEKQWIPEIVEFDENWVHRQPNRPVLTINFTADELIAHRQRMANPFFLRNFVRLRNLPFYARLAATALRYPDTLPRALLATLRSRRLEDGVEHVFARYQYQKYREGQLRTRALREAPRRPPRPARTPSPPAQAPEPQPPSYPSGHRTETMPGPRKPTALRVISPGAK